MVSTGVLLTCGAVTMAIKSIRNGNRAAAQKWFRYRVVFQAFTIAVLVTGGIFYGNKSKASIRSREELLAEKAKIRERLWIEELEKRDLEIKQRQRRAEYVRAARLEAAEKEKRELEKSQAPEAVLAENAPTENISIEKISANSAPIQVDQVD